MIGYLINVILPFCNDYYKCQMTDESAYLIRFITFGEGGCLPVCPVDVKMEGGG